MLVFVEVVSKFRKGCVCFIYLFLWLWVGDSFHLGSAAVFSQKSSQQKSASNAFFKRVLGSQPTKKI